MTDLNSPAALELAQTIGSALELASAGKPYADVIRHLGTMPTAVITTLAPPAPEP